MDQLKYDQVYKIPMIATCHALEYEHTAATVTHTIHIIYSYRDCI